MGIVLSRDLTLTAQTQTGISPGGVPLTGDNPIIGYDNFITVADVAADSSDPDFPILNVANPSTYDRWISANADDEVAQYVTIQVTRLSEIDYLAIAGHNFGSDQVSVQLEAAGNDVDSDGDVQWFELSHEFLPVTDDPILFRFEPQVLTMLRLRLVAVGGIVPEIAVIYSGELLILERRLFVGHGPISYNDVSNIVSGFSEQGQFLGRLLLGEYSGTELTLPNLTGEFVRQEFDPFRRHAKTLPFFFAWRPATYPLEVGYAWTTGDIQVRNLTTNGLMEAKFALQGITGG